MSERKRFEAVMADVRATEAKPSASAAPGIKTWKERFADQFPRFEVEHCPPDMMACLMAEEIAALRTAIAAAREEAARAWTKCDELEALNTNCNVVIADLRAAITAARKEGFEAGRLYEQEIATQEAEEAADRAEAEAVKRAEACSVPPAGWHCTRAAGHSGRCAAHPAQPQAKAPQQPPAGEDLEGLIPTGWKICTADFSHIAAGKTKPGNVMLVRDAEGKKAWHAPDEEARERTDLYIYGTGRTLREAVIHAAAQARDSK